MDILAALAQCLTGSSSSQSPTTSNLLSSDTKICLPTPKNEDELVHTLLTTLLTTEKSSPALRAQLQDLMHANNWTQSLAQRLLDGLIHALNSSAQMSGAMKDAFDKSSAAAEMYVKEHPVLTKVVVTVVAIGILAILVPWAVEALGFAELGPVAGKSLSYGPMV